MTPSPSTTSPPEILAPAGNQDAFLAALAAGADAVYCGLKRFSARMAAVNFDMDTLADLTRLAHNQGTQVFVTLNTLVRPEEITGVGRLLEQLERWVGPDAIIVQDLALIALARQVGYSGEVHLSTLANVTFAKALAVIKKDLGVDRVVLPRELNIDEIKACDKVCPDGMGLEVFVHGALCYAVSGRCYWSSYLGGKSGLRGRCVQPCRRVYTQDRHRGRLFACQDLSIDVLGKVLKTVPSIRAWKIEGRKKGAHYVYHTVKAYRLLRDHAGRKESWAKAKKEAEQLLDLALGRPGTHYNLLPQRPQNPLSPDTQTGSGYFLGRLKGTAAKPWLRPRIDLLPGDMVRLGYEDEPGHATLKLTSFTPRGGRMTLKPIQPHRFRKSAAVFLIDRRDKALQRKLARLGGELKRFAHVRRIASVFRVKLPRGMRKKVTNHHLRVYRQWPPPRHKGRVGMWLSPLAVEKCPGRKMGHVWWWLPPVVWPTDEGRWGELVQQVVRHGGTHFMVNAPGQTAFFDRPQDLHIWAGPFSNAANPLAIETYRRQGLKGVVVGPELGQEDYLQLPKHSPLPLGIVLAGNWPLCVSRTIPEHLRDGHAFTSPKGELAWVRRYENDWWLYPNWRLDLMPFQGMLERAGYHLMVHLQERVPSKIKLKRRPGLWNWKLSLT